MTTDIATSVNVREYVVLVDGMIVAGPFATEAEAVKAQDALLAAGRVDVGAISPDVSSKLKVGNMTMRSGIPKTSRNPRTLWRR